MCHAHATGSDSCVNEVSTGVKGAEVVHLIQTFRVRAELSAVQRSKLTQEQRRGISESTHAANAGTYWYHCLGKPLVVCRQLKSLHALGGSAPLLGMAIRGNLSPCTWMHWSECTKTCPAVSLVLGTHKGHSPRPSAEQETCGPVG